MMFNRRGPSGRNSPPCPSDEQAKEKLMHYVYEYLHHAGAKNSAETFKKECGLENHPIDLGEAPGFLRSWWSVFWDLYCAAPERRDNCEHSKERMDGGMPLVNGMHPGGPGGPTRFGMPNAGRGGPPNMSVSRDGSMPPFSGPQTSGGPMFTDPNGQMVRPGMPMMQPGGSSGPGGPQRLPASTGAHPRMQSMPGPPGGPGMPPNSYGMRQPNMSGPPRWAPTSSGMPYSVPSPGGAGPFPPMSMSNGPGNPIMASPQPMGAPYGDGRFPMMGPGGGPMPGGPYGMPGGPETSQAGPIGPPNGPNGGGGPNPEMSLNGGMPMGPGTPSSVGPPGGHSSTPTSSGPSNSGPGGGPSGGPNGGPQQQQQQSSGPPNANAPVGPPSSAGPAGGANSMDIKSSPSSSHGGGMNNGGTPLNAGPASVGQVGTPGGGGSATNPATPQPSGGSSGPNQSVGTPANAHATNGPPSVPSQGGPHNSTGGGGGRSSVPPNTEQMDCAPAFGDVGFQERDRSEIAKIKASMMEESKQFEAKSEDGDFYQ